MFNKRDLVQLVCIFKQFEISLLREKLNDEYVERKLMEIFSKVSELLSTYKRGEREYDDICSKILEITCSYFSKIRMYESISPDLVKSTYQGKDLSDVRHTYCYMCIKFLDREAFEYLSGKSVIKKLTRHTLTASISKIIKRSHSAVSTSVKKIDGFTLIYDSWRDYTDELYDIIQKELFND